MGNHKCPTGLPPGQPVVVGQLVADLSHNIGKIKISTVPYSHDRKSESFHPFRVQFEQGKPASNRRDRALKEIAILSM